MTPLEHILRTSDRAGLKAWLERRGGQERLPTHWTWQGPIDADLGRDICAATQRTTPALTSGQTLCVLIRRMASSWHIDAGYAGILSAVIGHIQGPAGGLTPTEGMNILDETLALIIACNRDVPQEACFAAIYDLIAFHVPLASALKAFEHDLDEINALFPQALALLAIYGPSAWSQIQPLVQRGHTEQRFSYVAPAAGALIATMATGSAHQLLPLFAHFHAQRLRVYAPQTIQHHLEVRLRECA